jgi:ribose transport system permease protein
MTDILTKPAVLTNSTRIWQRLSLGRYTGVVVALIIVVGYLTLTQEAFLSWANVMNIVKANSVVFVLAVGTTFIVISGGIDMSAASMVAASGMVLGLALEAGWSLPVALLAALAFGVAAGLLNGLLITRAKISFLVVTLGAMSIWSSFALIVNGSQSVSVYSSPGFGPLLNFVNGDIGPVPVLLVFDTVLALLAGFVLRQTAFGRALFATGSNQEAARLNGINVAAVLAAVYGIGGLAAGLSSIVLVGRLTAAPATADSTMLMTMLAAVLIGGTSFTGGSGGIVGTAIGVLFLSVLQNGLTLSDISSFWQGMVSGAILIVAVGLGVLRDHRYGGRLRP